MATQVAEPRYGLLRRIPSSMPSPIQPKIFGRCLFVLCAWIALLNSHSRTASAQEIWEFSPYRVQVWFSVDPALAISPQASSRLENDLLRQLDLVFGPTWNTKIDTAPAWLRYSIIHDLERLEANILSSGDFVMIVGKKNPNTDGIRSLDSFVDKGLDVMVQRKNYDSAMERLIPDPTATSFTRLRDLLKSEPKSSFQLVEAIAKDEIPAALISKIDMQLKADDLRLITSIGDFALVVPRKNAKTESIENLDAFNELKLTVAVPQANFEMLSTRLKEDAITRLKTLLRPTDKPTSQLAAEVAAGQIPAAIVMKDDLARNSENARSLVVKFSNQSDAFLDRHDKLYFAGLKLSSNGPILQVRELDCPSRRLSHLYQRNLYHPTQQMAAPIAGLIRDCFTPIARIEESAPTTVKMRGRAAGLVTSDMHPVLLQPGDVLQAVVRRNDRNGQPSLLETVPWTFIVATDVQREHIDGFVYTGIRGGLEGRRNARTQRLAMLVKPIGTNTDLQVVTQNAKDKPLAATQIFERLPGGDKSNPIGRTDWRGVLKLPVPKEPPIATARIPVVKPETPAEATESAPPASSEAAVTPVSAPAQGNQTTPATSPPAAGEAAAAAAEPEEIVKTITLRAPLMIYYVKNGETLLARLPVVVGLSPVVTAEVPDDSRRLQAEGFLKGLQSEVVDVVASRQVAAARVRMRIEERKFELATQMLGDLQKIKDYEKMARELDDIQRKVLDPAGGTITPVAQMRIEKMFQQTRELLQKYLQNDLVKKVEKELEAAIKAGDAPAETAPTAAPTPTPPASTATPAAAPNSAPQSSQPQPPQPEAAPMTPTGPAPSSGVQPPTPNSDQMPMRKASPPAQGTLSPTQGR